MNIYKNSKEIIFIFTKAMWADNSVASLKSVDELSFWYALVVLNDFACWTRPDVYEIGGFD